MVVKQSKNRILDIRKTLTLKTKVVVIDYLETIREI